MAKIKEKKEKVVSRKPVSDKQEEKIKPEKVEEKSVGKVKAEKIKPAKAGGLLEKYQTHKDDTGSTEVQIVVLTKKIAELTKHLKEHRHDFDSRVGLLKMVGKRRRLLNYFKKTDEERYTGLIVDLKLRK